MSGPFCKPKFDGLGTACCRCGCWKRGTEPPDCPPFVTRCEPDNARLPHIKTAADNTRLHRQWLSALAATCEAGERI